MEEKEWKYFVSIFVDNSMKECLLEMEDWMFAWEVTPQYEEWASSIRIQVWKEGRLFLMYRWTKEKGWSDWMVY